MQLGDESLTFRNDGNNFRGKIPISHTVVSTGPLAVKIQRNSIGINQQGVIANVPPVKMIYETLQPIDAIAMNANE